MSAQLLELKKDLKAEIAASLNREGELSDAALYQTIDEKLLSRDDLSLKNKLYLRNAVFNSFRRLDVLQELLDNPAITEIMINSDKEIFVEAGGRMQRWDKLAKLLIVKHNDQIMRPSKDGGVIPGRHTSPAYSPVFVDAVLEATGERYVRKEVQ